MLHNPCTFSLLYRITCSSAKHLLQQVKQRYVTVARGWVEQLKIVRFNPDPTGSFPIGLEERTRMLLEHVVQSMQSAPVRDLEVEYFLYD